MLLCAEGRFGNDDADGGMSTTPEMAEAAAAEALGAAAAAAAHGEPVQSADDIEARARAAAAACVHLEGEQRPTYLVTSLHELQQLLESKFVLVGAPQQ
jgi:hypothetical protein